MALLGIFYEMLVVFTTDLDEVGSKDFNLVDIFLPDICLPDIFLPYFCLLEVRTSIPK